MARSKMMNAVDSYAKANHISRDEAFGQLMDKSVRGDVSGEAYVGARGGVGFGSSVMAVNWWEDVGERDSKFWISRQYY
jgi:uncharacterized protein (UPF0254 family)